MQEQTESIALPALSLSLTFLCIGASFAMPMSLLPPSSLELISPQMTREVANMYAIVAWAGLAHFAYAYRGQVAAVRTLAPQALPIYLLVVLGSLLLLFGFRSLVGIGLFGALIWTYFIFHFHRAEVHFEGGSPKARDWADPIRVIGTFAWLSVVLLNAGNVIEHPWIIWTVSLGLGMVVLLQGGLERLIRGKSRNTLLSTFFVAEAMVWGTYGRYAGADFLYGVYVFHIAAGSYFHYFGSYFAGYSRSQGRDGWLRASAVLSVNLCLLGVGFLVAQSEGLRWLRPIFAVEWFTFWVGAHLVISDLFPGLKKRLTVR